MWWLKGIISITLYCQHILRPFSKLFSSIILLNSNNVGTYTWNSFLTISVFDSLFKMFQDTAVDPNNRKCLLHWIFQAIRLNTIGNRYGSNLIQIYFNEYAKCSCIRVHKDIKRCVHKRSMRDLFLFICASW